MPKYASRKPDGNNASRQHSCRDRRRRCCSSLTAPPMVVCASRHLQGVARRSDVYKLSTYRSSESAGLILLCISSSCLLCATDESNSKTTIVADIVVQMDLSDCYLQHFHTTCPNVCGTGRRGKCANISRRTELFAIISRSHQFFSGCRSSSSAAAAVFRTTSDRLSDTWPT